MQPADPYSPCPCGSGKKYKFCCLQRDRERQRPETLLGTGKIDFSERIPATAVNSVESEYLNDEGILRMEAGDFKGAAKRFRRAIRLTPENPAGYNNLAYCTFRDGDLEGAIQQQRQAIEELFLANPFGLAQMAHFLLVADQEREAEDYLERAMAMATASPYALNKACQLLAMFGRHAEILDLADSNPGLAEPLTHWYAGIAAANLGQYDQGLKHLRQAIDDTSLETRAGEMIRKISNGSGPGTVEGNWPYFVCPELVPITVIKRVLRDQKAGKDYAVAASRSRLLVDAVVSLLGDDEDMNVKAVDFLSTLKHPRVDEILVKLATGTFGGDDLRMTVMRHLVGRGVWSNQEPYTIWMQGNWRKLKFQGYGINAEQPASAFPVPEALHPRYAQAIKLGHRKRWKEAEKLWRELLAEAPEHTPFHFNLGVCLMQQGRKEAEAEACLRRAMAMEPGYLFAPASLAILCGSHGRLEEARQIINAITMPENVHPEALVAYYSAQIQVAMMEEKPGAALKWLKIAKEVTPDNPTIQTLAEHLKDLETIDTFRSQLRKLDMQLDEQMRQRVLAREATMEEGFEVFGKDDLFFIMENISVDVGRDAMAKDELINRLCFALRTPQVCRRAVSKLNPRELAALRNLHAAGGIQDHAEFLRQHLDACNCENDELGELLDETVADALMWRGLLVKATVNRVESVFIPKELPLDTAWLSPSRR